MAEAAGYTGHREVIIAKTRITMLLCRNCPCVLQNQCTLYFIGSGKVIMVILKVIILSGRLAQPFPERLSTMMTEQLERTLGSPLSYKWEPPPISSQALSSSTSEWHWHGAPLCPEPSPSPHFTEMDKRMSHPPQPSEFCFFYVGPGVSVR